MQDLANSVVVFLILCASAALGFFIHPRLPEHHRSRESMAIVQLVMTLLVNFTAIVLGLLTTSVKSGFDAAYQARGEDAAQIVQLDRCLRDYGPETAHIREQLRGYVAAVLASTWPDEPPPAGVIYPDPSKMPLTGEAQTLSIVLGDVGREIRSLQPSSPAQNNVLVACGEQFRDMLKARWKVIEGARASISAPFYWVLVFWLAILFGTFGLAGRPNTMIMTVIGLCVLSVTVAVFVILDLDSPYGGVFGIPSATMRNALADLMR
jgi:multisubunit Na+/H+ antiporter MnhC subunit